MGRYRCPSCSTIVESSTPESLVCPSCGFGSRSAPAAPPTPDPVPPPPASPYRGGTPYGGSPAVYAPPPPAAYAPAPSGFAPPPAGYAPVPYAAPPPLRTHGASVTALVLGILGFCVGWFTLGFGVPGLILAIAPSVAAVVLGSVGIQAANSRPQEVGGKGMAVAGLVLGIVSLAVWVFIFIIFVAFLEALGAWP